MFSIRHFQQFHNLHEIVKNLEKKLRRIFKVEPFIIGKFKWEEIKKWKRYEKNSHKTALNILCKNKRIYPAYVFSSA